MFYEKAVHKNFSIVTGKHLFESPFKVAAGIQVCNFRKKHRCSSVDITKFFKKVISQKISDQLLLNNVKSNYSFMKTSKQVLNVSQHSQENTITGVSLLKNIVAACNLSLSLFKKRFRHWCFLDRQLKFLTTTFLKRKRNIVTRKKKNYYRKRG